MIPSGLIISCQALAGNPLRNSERLAYMAESAALGGAAAIRANGAEDIAAIYKRIDLPIIGINKRKDSNGRTVITPDYVSAKSIADVGASAIAMDCTFYESDIRSDRAELIQRIHEDLKLPVLADISTAEEAAWAASIGADAISTTLAGYIPGAEYLPWQQYTPDFPLICKILDLKLPIKVYGEGRFWNGEDVTQAFRLGVDGIIIGKAVTNPMAATKYYVACANKAKSKPIGTETRNQETINIDKVSTTEILNLINISEKNTANIVGAVIPEISPVVDATVAAILKGGRVFYVGAGTSARLAAADAAECPPTYGVSRECFQAVVAGGNGALINATENSEDDENAAQKAFIDYGIKPGDVVIGISVAGKAPFVVSFMKTAIEKGCIVGAFVNNPDTPMEKLANYTVHLFTGAEVIKGSTRMKAGTSQKMLLNMFSTAVCIKLGCTFSNYMVNMKATNIKLKKRAIKMFSEITGESEQVSEKLLIENDWTVKNAILAWKKAN